MKKGGDNRRSLVESLLKLLGEKQSLERQIYNAEHVGYLPHIQDKERAQREIKRAQREIKDVKEKIKKIVASYNWLMRLVYQKFRLQCCLEREPVGAGGYLEQQKATEQLKQVDEKISQIIG